MAEPNGDETMSAAVWARRIGISQRTIHSPPRLVEWASGPLFWLLCGWPARPRPTLRLSVHPEIRVEIQHQRTPILCIEMVRVPVPPSGEFRIGNVVRAAAGTEEAGSIVQ